MRACIYKVALANEISYSFQTGCISSGESYMSIKVFISSIRMCKYYIRYRVIFKFQVAQYILNSLRLSVTDPKIQLLLIIF